MHWSDHADAVAPALPAVWIVRTGASPRDLTERSALRRGTARRILARQLGCRECDVVIGHDPAGRPLLALPGSPGLHLSLATRAGVVAVGLARRPLGVDVEMAETGTAPPLALLHPQERAFLDGTTPDARPLAFARLWAAKEAYVKALGAGFVRAPESFRVSLPSQARFAVLDPLRRAAAGEIRLVENGGRDALAAAAIVLD